MATGPRFRSSFTGLFPLAAWQAVAHAPQAEAADGPMGAVMTDRPDGTSG